MSDKIHKLKPDKIKKRVVCTLKKQRNYARMIKTENADYKTVNKQYRRLHGVDMPIRKFYEIKPRFIFHDIILIIN